VARPVLRDVLEELLPRKLGALADDARQPAVVEGHVPHLARLAAKAKAQRSSANLHVPGSQGRQPERAIRPRVLLVSDADVRELEEADAGRQYLLSRQSAAREVALAGRTHARKRPRERDHPVELRRVADLVPSRLVAVLLAASRVAAHRLDVTVGHRANPDLAPGGRNGQLPDAGQRGKVAQSVAVRVEIGEGIAERVIGLLPCPDGAAKAGCLLRVDVAKARSAS
jgi:hypothetical protein